MRLTTWLALTWMEDPCVLPAPSTGKKKMPYADGGAAVMSAAVAAVAAAGLLVQSSRRLRRASTSASDDAAATPVNKRDTDTDSTVEVSTRVRTALAEVDDVEDVRQKLDRGLSAEAGPLPGAIHTTIPRAIFSGEEPTEESSHYSPAIEPPIEVPFATMPDAVWPELAAEPPKEASYDLVSLSDALSARLHGEEEPCEAQVHYQVCHCWGKPTRCFKPC